MTFIEKPNNDDKEDVTKLLIVATMLAVCEKIVVTACFAGIDTPFKI